MLCLVNLREMQTWGSLERKNIMKMHKQLAVLASEIEPQGQLGKKSSVSPNGVYKYCFEFKV